MAELTDHDDEAASKEARHWVLGITTGFLRTFLASDEAEPGAWSDYQAMVRQAVTEVSVADLMAAFVEALATLAEQTFRLELRIAAEHNGEDELIVEAMGSERNLETLEGAIDVLGLLRRGVEVR